MTTDQTQKQNSEETSSRVDRRSALKRIAGTALAVTGIGLLAGSTESCRRTVYSDYYSDYSYYYTYYYYYYSK